MVERNGLNRVKKTIGIGAAAVAGAAVGYYAPELRNQLPEIGKEVAFLTGVGVLRALPGIAWVTAGPHRMGAHGSLWLHENINKAGRFLMGVYAPEPAIWSDIHGDLHHPKSDTNLYGVWKTARRIREVEANPDRYVGLDIPDSYPHMDPYIDDMSKDDVLMTGDFADRLVQNYLKDEYEPIGPATLDEAHRDLHPTEPLYYYKKGPRHVTTQDQKVRILLADPHSPALVGPPEENGVRGVLKNNVNLYREASHLFQDYPEYMVDDLRPDKQIDHTKTRIKSFVENSLLNSAVIFAARQSYDPEGVLRALLEGAAINGIALLVHLYGGNATNAMGHEGKTNPKRFLQAIVNNRFKPSLNLVDGTIATNSVEGGFVGRLIGWSTFGEVSGQKVHHDYPGRIAYTLNTGWRGWYDDPWGMTLHTLAHSKRFPWIKPGPRFSMERQEDRPDMPNLAVKRFEELRREQARKDRNSEKQLVAA